MDDQKLTHEQYKVFEKDFFETLAKSHILISRSRLRSYVGGFIAVCLLLIGGSALSAWVVAKNTLSTAGYQKAMEDIYEAQAIAQKMIDGVVVCKSLQIIDGGMIELFDKNKDRRIVLGVDDRGGSAKLMLGTSNVSNRMFNNPADYPNYEDQMFAVLAARPKKIDVTDNVAVALSLYGEDAISIFGATSEGQGPDTGYGYLNLRALRIDAGGSFLKNYERSTTENNE